MGLIANNGGIPQFLSGSISIDGLPPVTVTASQNNFAPNGIGQASLIPIQPTVALSITGLLAGAAWERKVLANVGAVDITLTNNSGASDAANRFALGANYTLSAGRTIELLYNPIVALWVALSATSGGGTGTTPASPANAVQFNNAGAFGGSVNFTYDPVTGILALAGPLVLGQNTAWGQSATAVDIQNGNTITTAATGVSRVTTSQLGNVTGVIMEAGTIAGQKCTVINESVTFTMTMAAAATSNVAEGVTCIIGTNKAKSFTWNNSTSRWYAE